MDSGTFTSSISVSEPPKKGGAGNFIKIIAFLMILGFVGAGAALASRVWDPLWSPFRPAPERVLAGMTSQTQELKTCRNKTNFSLFFKNKDEIEIEGNFSASSDATNPENQKSDGKFDFNLSVEGMQFYLAGDFKTINETFYFKLTTIPVMLQPFFAMMGIDLEQFKNQWVKFDKESMEEMFSGSLSPEMLKEFKEESEKNTEKEREIKEKVTKLVANKELYFVKNELDDEKVNGIKNYHYQVALNNEELEKIIPELLKIIWETGEMPNMPGATPEEFQKEVQEKIGEFLNKLGEITADVWIGKKDLYLYKFQLEKEIDISKFDEKEKGTVLIKIVGEYDNFNQPVEITAPAEFKTIKEIFSPILEQSIISQGSRARDDRRKADLSQIRAILELYYSDNYSYPQSLSFPETALKKYYSTTLTDPGNGPCPGLYGWIKNVGYPDKYCLYACLESGEYYAVSPDTTMILSFPPTSLDCGVEESSSPELKFPSKNPLGSRDFFTTSLLDAFYKIFRK